MDDDAIDAGSFGPWLDEVLAAVRDGAPTDVPCGPCTACCSSSQFVHIAPDETAALARIPKALLFPAPRAPKGHVLMGYDEHGRCPMLVDGACSIYADRPRTCRTYDCRVFAAAGVDPDKPLIAERIARWRFRTGSEDDEVRAAAVRAAAAFVRERGRALPEDERPVTATQEAVLAVELHAAFLAEGDDGSLERRAPSDADVRATLVALRRRD